MDLSAGLDGPVSGIEGELQSQPFLPKSHPPFLREILYDTEGRREIHCPSIPTPQSPRIGPPDWDSSLVTVVPAVPPPAVPRPRHLPLVTPSLRPSSRSLGLSSLAVVFVFPLHSNTTIARHIARASPRAHAGVSTHTGGMLLVMPRSSLVRKFRKLRELS